MLVVTITKLVFNDFIGICYFIDVPTILILLLLYKLWMRLISFWEKCFSLRILNEKIEIKKYGKSLPDLK